MYRVMVRSREGNRLVHPVYVWNTWTQTESFGEALQEALRLNAGYDPEFPIAQVWSESEYMSRGREVR